MTSAAPIRATVINTARSPRRGADPHGLAWSLMDNVRERIEAARVRRGDTRPLLESAVMIIGELRAGLDLHHGGPVAANVDDLYDYMCRRLNAAELPNGLAALDEVSHLLQALRSAWAFMPREVRAASRN